MDSTTYFSYVIFYNDSKKFINSSHFQTQTKENCYKPQPQRIAFHKFNVSHTTRAYSSGLNIHSSPRSNMLLIRTVTRACSVHSSSRPEPEPEPDNDHKAMEAVLKLYTAIKNKNFNEISDIIGEECLCTCNFVSSFQPFRGKEQVLEFFSALMKRLGNNFEFVIQPIFQDGLNVGVSWKLEWKQTQIPIGKGFSFYMCHVYQGKVIIKNMEMLLEPIVHIEPIRMKMITTLASALDKFSSRAQLKCREILRDLKILIIIFLLLAALFSFLR